MAISLLIKGNIYEARDALDLHKLQTVEALDPLPHAGLVKARVHDSDLATVQAWIAEPTIVIPGFGFQAGALLLFRMERVTREIL